jgi:antitoxin VapB
VRKAHALIGLAVIQENRNLANDQNTFHRVTTLTPATIAAFGVDPVSYMDSSPDTGASGISANPTVNLDGPEISFGLPLVDVVSRNGVKPYRSQAVRLPKEFQFKTKEVFIRKEGENVILSPRPMNWEPYLSDGPVASDEFMEGVEDLPVQERER